VSLRPAALVYIMQMGTAEGQSNRYFLFFVETDNYSVALSRTLEALLLYRKLLKSISTPKGAISFFPFFIYIHVSHGILQQKQS